MTSLVFDYLANFLSALAELLLKPADELVFLSLRIFEVVVSQLGVLLFKLTFDLVPRAFDLEFVHINSSFSNPLPAARQRLNSGCKGANGAY